MYVGVGWGGVGVVGGGGGAEGGGGGGECCRVAQATPPFPGLMFPLLPLDSLGLETA